ncbi:MAG TPA: 2-amino-4-hydroxy-6-hydroxymethyldihydropteridine diphosphokinase [Galbitalea sp.]|jgi:2-amino-4-hydroxy-6-hydroxymethyldihydropteridine diphosphokinase
MSRAVLSLGSNLGEREQTIRSAVDDLAAVPGMIVDAVSGFVETAAVKTHGVDESAPAYLNVAVIVTTDLDPHELLRQTATIEVSHGRVREERWGDRTLDIDIVAYDQLQLESDDLVLPHPRAAAREFVLVPWLEIDPNAELPGVGRIDELPAAKIDVKRHPGRHS